MSPAGVGSASGICAADDGIMFAWPALYDGISRNKSLDAEQLREGNSRIDFLEVDALVGVQLRSFADS